MLIMSASDSIFADFHPTTTVTSCLDVLKEDEGPSPKDVNMKHQEARTKENNHYVFLHKSFNS